MEQPHILRTGSNYRTPVKLGTRWRKDQVGVLLLGQEFRRHELLRRKDVFNAQDQAKASQCKDTDMEESPIESTNANNWEDVVDTDDIPTNHIYISTLLPYKQQYSRHILSEGS